MVRGVVIILCFVGWAGLLHAQEHGDVYVIGDEITIDAGSNVYIHGSYQDEVGDFLFFGTAASGSLANGDTLYIGRNIINNSSHNLNISDFGTITLFGDTLRYIDGQNPVRFHNLFLEMDTSVQMYQLADVTDSLLMVSGYVNLDTADAGINLGPFGHIYGEDETRYFYGSLGKVVMTDRALTGMLNNISGTGVSMDVNGSLGVSTIERYNWRHAGAANGSIYRFYKLIPANSGNLNSFSIKYLAHEVGTVDEGQITMWHSKNNGVLWDQIQTARFTALDSAAGSNIPVVTSGTLLTLADSICTTVPTVNLGPDLAICAGDPVTLDAKNPGLFYFWNTGETTQTIEVSVPGDYWVLVTNANGCVGADTITLVSKSYPVIDFTANYECQGVSTTFTNNSSIDEGGLTWHWDFGVENSLADTSNLQNPVFLYDTAGLYKVVLEATSDFGCVSRDTLDYVVHPLPQPRFDLDSLCLGLTNTFTDQSIILPNIGLISYNISSWDWDFGDPNTTADVSTQQSPSYTYTQSGSYQVRLALESNAGCRDTLVQNVLVHPIVAVDFSATDACVEESINFTNLSSLASGTATYLWDFDDGNTATETNPSHEYAQNGQYSVTLEATTDQGCVTSSSKTIEAFANPKPAFSFQNACVGVDIQLANLTTINSSDNLSFSWDFGDGTNSMASTPTKTYSAPGEYTVLLSVTSENGCVRDTSQMITIFPEPVADFNAVNVCLGEETQFFNTSSISSGTVSYLWDFGDGNTSTVKNPVHTYAASGTYDVTLTVSSGNGCQQTITKTVESYALPFIDIQPVITTCATSIVLDAGNPGSTYAWQDNSTNQTFNVTKSGTYTVTVINANGCTSSATTQVTLESVFNPNLAAEIEGCDLVVLDGGNAGAQSYLWSTGETTRSIEVTTSGTYTVDIVDQNGCPGSQSIDVTVHTTPTVDLGSDQAICSGSTVTLDAGITGATYLWSTGETTQTIEVSSTGTYGVTVTSAEGCAASDEVQVTVNPLPVVDLGDDRQVCGSLLLDAGNEGANYLWQDGSTSQTFNVTTSGTYSVQVTDANGCVNADEVTLTVEANPVVDLGPDLDLCSGETVVLDAENAGATFLWSTGATSQTIEVVSSGIYEVSVTNSLGCTVTDAIEVTIHPKVVVDLGEDRSICSGNEVTLDAGYGGMGYSYNWSSQSIGFTSDQQVVTLTEDDLYWVTVITDVGCMGVDSIKINVATDTLSARFVVAAEAEVFDTVYFVSLSVPLEADHLWKFGDGNRSTLQDPAHIYLRAGTYQTTLEVSKNQCSDAISKLITITEPTGESSDENEEAGRVDEQPTEFVKSSIIPNPNNGFFVLDLELSKEGRIHLILLNNNGKIIEERDFENLAELNETFDIRRHASGVYLMRITTADNQKTLRILKN